MTETLMPAQEDLDPAHDPTHQHDENDRTDQHDGRSRARHHAPESPVRGPRTTELFDATVDATDDEREALIEQVVVLNMPVARSVASRYRRRGVADDDLEQVAYLALVKAAQRFDPARHKDFLSYAVPTIRGEIKRWFRDRGWTVRPTRRVQELQLDVFHADGELAQLLGRSPRPSEIAEHLGVEVDLVMEALSTDGCFTPLSLDVPVGDDGFAKLGDLIPAQDQPDAAADARVMLGPLVRDLGDRDRRILRMRFFDGCTQQEIADVLGVTQMQVSRLLSRILRQLREGLAEDGVDAVSML